MANEANKLSLLIQNGGQIETLEEKRFVFSKDLVCLMNYYNSSDIFESVLQELLDSQIVFLEDLKEHLRFLLSQFEDIQGVTQNLHKIEIGKSKMMIMETARDIYHYISRMTLEGNKGK